MFKKPKLYKIVYKIYDEGIMYASQSSNYTTIFKAKNEFQAIDKFHEMVKNKSGVPSIISIQEYSLGDET